MQTEHQRARRAKAVVIHEGETGMDEISQTLPHRTEGPFTPAEISALARAYLAGAHGEVLVGMRQRARLLTLHLPAQPTAQAATVQMGRIAARLRSLGCDGWLHARRARLRPAHQVTVDALLLDEDVLEHGGRRREQSILLLRDPLRRWRLVDRVPLADEVTRTLWAALGDNKSDESEIR